MRVLLLEMHTSELIVIEVSWRKNSCYLQIPLLWSSTCGFSARWKVEGLKTDNWPKILWDKVEKSPGDRDWSLFPSMRICIP